MDDYGRLMLEADFESYFGSPQDTGKAKACAQKDHPTMVHTRKAMVWLHIWYSQQARRG
jgi:hypothetical protein